ncbi:MAG TPA: nucleotide exchange factor GrpE [Kiritimatiellia bacterium]|jgi:molecular chaperone GrpE
MRDRNRRTESEDPPAPEPQGDGEPAPTDVQDQAATADAEPTPNEASQQISEQRDRYLRLAAEYDNYRKRSAKERAESGSRAQADLIGKLLESLDDLQRFAHVDPATTDSLTLHKGIELVEQKMLKALGAAGLEVVNPVDQTFDPTIHEAITTEPALSPEDDHVVAKVFQPGYRFNGQLLRPARVVVKQWRG